MLCCVCLRCLKSSVLFTHQSFWCHLLLTEAQDPPAASHRPRVWERSAYTDPQKNPPVPPHICKFNPHVDFLFGLFFGLFLFGFLLLLLFFLWCMDLLRERKFPSPYLPGSRSRSLGSEPSATLPLSSKRPRFTKPSPFLWREECPHFLL